MMVGRKTFYNILFFHFHYKQVFNDLVRFNEAIDQSLNESIVSYSSTNEQQVHHLATMLSSAPDLSYIIDLNGVLLYVNEAMSNLYQKPAPSSCVQSAKLI